MQTKIAGQAKTLTTGFIFNGNSLVEVAKLHASIPPLTKEASSNEIKQPSNSTNTDVPIVEPPYDLASLAALYEKSPTHFIAVKAKADDAVGLGWTIQPKGDAAGSVASKERATAFIESLNTEYGFDNVLNCALVDFESLGMGYVEVARDQKNNTIGLINHIQGTTIRVCAKMPLYLHTRGNKKVYFKKFGDETQYDKNTGQPGTNIPVDNRANELYLFKKYHPKSDFYGIPDIVPAFAAILGDIMAREYNLDFFNNGAIPAYAVVVKGADVGPDLKAAIEHFFKHDLKGTGNTQKTFVLPVPYEGVEVEFKALNVDMKDGSFKLYRADNAQEILSVHGVPPARAMNFKQGALGGDISKEADKIYRETVVARNRRMAERFANLILAEAGFDSLALKFNRSRFSDIGLIGSFLTAAKGSSAITPNEMREIAAPLFENGLEGIDGGDEIPEPQPAPNPFGGGFDDGKRKSGHKHEDFSRLSKKRVEYDDIEFDMLTQYSGEYEGAKDGRAVSASRLKGDAVETMKSALIRVYNSCLKDVYATLKKNGSKSIMGVVFQKEQAININPILATIQKRTDDFEAALRDAYPAGLTAGAKYSALRLKAQFSQKAGGPIDTGEMDLSDLNDDVQVSFNLNNPSVQKFIDTQSAAISINLSKSLSARIRRQLEKSIEKGESNEQAAERLRKTVGIPDLRDSAGRLITSETRAEMIARTEIGDAFNLGSLMGYKDSGVVDAVEVLDGDEWDEPCKQADGQQWSFRKAENNSLEHPNCTRVFVPVVKEPIF